MADHLFLQIKFYLSISTLIHLHVSTAALILQWQSWVAVTEVNSPQSQKYYFLVLYKVC